MKIQIILDDDQGKPLEIVERDITADQFARVAGWLRSYFGDPVELMAAPPPNDDGTPGDAPPPKPLTDEELFVKWADQTLDRLRQQTREHEVRQKSTSQTSGFLD